MITRPRGSRLSTSEYLERPATIFLGCFASLEVGRQRAQRTGMPGSTRATEGPDKGGGAVSRALVIVAYALIVATAIVAAAC